MYKYLLIATAGDSGKFSTTLHAGILLSVLIEVMIVPRTLAATTHVRGVFRSYHSSKFQWRRYECCHQWMYVYGLVG